MATTLPHTLPQSLTFMFKDEDWFRKVFLGAVVLVLIPLAVGYVFTIGYLVETVRHCRRDAAALPEWNRLGTLWTNGLSVGTALAAYGFIVCAALSLAMRHATPVMILLGVVLVHVFIGPFVIIRYLEHPVFTSCFDLRSIIGLMRRGGLRALSINTWSFGIFVVVLCFGWMALIIGWPLFIFWGMLVSASCTASLELSTSPIEAPAP